MSSEMKRNGGLGHRVMLSALIATTTLLAGWGGPVQSHVAPVSQLGTALVALTASGIETPPVLPKAWQGLSGSVVAGADVGYLPGESSVTPGGEYTYQIPLQVPDGRAGMAPTLSLTYSSGNVGNGLLGVGWSLSGLSSITRCRKTLASDGVVSGISMRAGDAYCLDGQKLIALKGQAKDVVEYRTEHDSYARIVSQSSSDAMGPSLFTVERKDGRILEYDFVSAKRQSGMPSGYVPTDNEQTDVHYVWLLARERDRAGNQIEYHYSITNLGSPVGLEILPSEIVYTSMATGPIGPQITLAAQRSVRFSYDTRPDTRFAWNAGVRTNLSKRLKTIAMYAPSPSSKALVWQYNLQYEPLPSSYSGRSLLTSVERCGSTTDPAAVNHGCLWKKVFDWYPADPTPQFKAQDLGVIPFNVPAGNAVFNASSAHYPYLMALDADGDGVDDLLYQAGKSKPGDPQVLMLFTAVHNSAGTVFPLLGVHTLDPGVFGKTFVQDYLQGDEANMLAQMGSYGFPPPKTALEEVSLQHVRPVVVHSDGTTELWVSPIVTKVDAGYQTICQSQLWYFNGTQFTQDTTFPLPNPGQCGPLSQQRDVFFDFDGDGRLDLATLKDPDGPTVWALNADAEETLDGTNLHYKQWPFSFFGTDGMPSGNTSGSPQLFGSQGGTWRFYHNEGDGQGLETILLQTGTSGQFTAGSADSCALGQDTFSWDYDPADQTSVDYFYNANGRYHGPVTTTARAIPHFANYSPGVVLDRQGDGRGLLAIGKDQLWGLSDYETVQGVVKGTCTAISWLPTKHRW